ncbi:MAG: hypothetical protein QY325_04300 [Flavobacteriales bacterium]|nr:MAG: hypothetical protein QY325_04300 [Flavobacteriales bacterium]
MMMLRGGQHLRTPLTDEHRAALRGMEEALAVHCYKRLQERFSVEPYAAAALVIQWINEVEAAKRGPVPPRAKR